MARSTAGSRPGRHGPDSCAFGIVVAVSSPIRNWADYVAAAKANPGRITYSTQGAATTNHLTMARITRRAGIASNHIPHKGSADSLQALLAGQVESAAETSAWAPFVRDGRMRLIATWNTQRMAGFPDGHRTQYERMAHTPMFALAWLSIACSLYFLYLAVTAMRPRRANRLLLAAIAYACIMPGLYFFLQYRLQRAADLVPSDETARRLGAASR